MNKKNVGIYIFENMTMMDAYAPLQFFAIVEEMNTFTFAKTNAPLMSDAGALLTPHYGFADCPKIDVLVVPGGGNTLAQMKDSAVITHLQAVGAAAEYVTSVCTGSLILAEAGLLDGYKVATHWGYTDVLRAYPAVTQIDERVVVDRNRITGGGITAGLDFALTIIAEVIDEPTAHAMQLIFEYRPQPPFNSGGPETAPPPVVAAVRSKIDSIAADLKAFAREKAA